MQIVSQSKFHFHSDLRMFTVSENVDLSKINEEFQLMLGRHLVTMKQEPSSGFFKLFRPSSESIHKLPKLADISLVI